MSEAFDQKTEVQRQIAGGAKLLPESIREICECFCGCGSPEVAWQWILDYFTSLESKDFINRWRPGETGPEYIAVYLMGHLDLTEHGTSVRGCWLTDKGKEALSFLREYGPEWDDKGWWVDSTGCCHGEPPPTAPSIRKVQI